MLLSEDRHKGIYPVSVLGLGLYGQLSAEVCYLYDNTLDATKSAFVSVQVVNMDVV